MMKTLYLWGVDSLAHPISGESIAIMWYMQQHRCVSDVTVVFANNTDMSPLHKLPVLHVGDYEYVHGLEDIVKTIYPNVNDHYTVEQKLMERAVFSILDNDLRLLTEYQLFLDRKNYVDYTRKQFSKLLYFPFNYNCAYEMRNKAKTDCAHLEYLAIDDNDVVNGLNETIKEDSEDYELAQSKTFKIQGIRKKQQTEELKNVRLNRKYMRALLEFLKQWEDVSLKLSDQSPAFYLFYAYMYVQLIILPNGQDISDYIQNEKGKKYIDELVNTCEKYHSKVDFKLHERPVSFKEQGNLLSSILHILHV